MKAAVKTLENKAAGDVTLADAVFGIQEIRKDILWRVVNWQLAKRQAGTHKVKEIGEVQGSTRKPWKQKGTGRARAGSNYSPHFRGGATVFGPQPRSHAHDLPKKIRSLGMKMALSSKQAEGKLVIVDDLTAKSAKTKDLRVQLEKFGQSLLLVGGQDIDQNFRKAASNIPQVDVLPVQGANVYDILRRDTLVISKAAVEALTERLSDDKKPAAKTTAKTPAKKAATAEKKAAPAQKAISKKPATQASAKKVTKKAAPKKTGKDS